MNKPKVALLLDSGAFSAYTQHAPIDIDKYATFALENQQHLKAVINLDVIMPTDVERAAKESLENFQYLKQKGLLTLPVFHAGESISYLDKMLEETDYIGLSTSMSSNQNDAFNWYDIVWSHVTDQNGYPVARFHAFGDAVPRTLLDYPWYSADSTTWYIAAGMAGNILINDRYVSWRPNSAKNSGYIGKEDSGIKREVWEKSFIEAGLDPTLCIETEMRESDKMLIRAYMNAHYFLQLQEKTRDRQAFTGAQSILISKKHSKGGIPMVDPLNLHFVITSSTATRSLAVLAQLSVKNLLISYFYTTPKQWSELILPFLYDPIGTCKENPKLKQQCEILSKFLLAPAIV